MTDRTEAERLADPFLAGLRRELNSALYADIHAPEASWQAIAALFARLDARDATIASLERCVAEKDERYIQLQREINADWRNELIRRTKYANAQDAEIERLKAIIAAPRADDVLREEVGRLQRDLENALLLTANTVKFADAWVAAHEVPPTPDSASMALGPLPGDLGQPRSEWAAINAANEHERDAAAKMTQDVAAMLRDRELLGPLPENAACHLIGGNDGSFCTTHGSDVIVGNVCELSPSADDVERARDMKEAGRILFGANARKPNPLAQQKRVAAALTAAREQGRKEPR